MVRSVKKTLGKNGVSKTTKRKFYQRVTEEIVLSDGAVYTGQVINGKRDGQGILKKVCGLTY